ncbi:hypothetical protein LNTAR_25470 [Lentisphaera araneosa HTCC2155]|uniref:Helix-turn-helix domain-containing protein n=1 Tax=Lentisphaera araneosa HTCC2155 TaxID=313628 RepID=A6DSD6_9BACT|nr:hypothetical protein [Lentisphaera araneosa]EDM25481.1 hypothetical protein LNTAR_25470 [Lentisphaera araneosa HTCC2155]
MKITRVVNKDILLKEKGYSIYPVELDTMDLTSQEFRLCVYIASKPSSWDFAYDRIAKDLKINPRTAKLWLKAIEKKGILERIKNAKTGRTKYILKVCRFEKEDTEPSSKIGQLSYDFAKKYMLFVKTQVAKKELIDEDDPKHAKEISELVNVDGVSSDNLSRVIDSIICNYLEYRYWDVSDTKKLRENFDTVHKKTLELEASLPTEEKLHII